MENYAIQASHHILVTFGIILITGVIFSKLADLIKMPDVVIFLLAGVLIGPNVLNLISIPVDSTTNQLILTLGASVLLFHGGLNVEFKTLRKVWITLLLLATLAVVIMVAIVGITAHLILGIGLVYALLLAAILAPTDPATLVPLFLSVKIKERLGQTVLSESAFNDATGAILTFAIISIITTGEFSVTSSIIKFFIMAGGGILIGALYGLVVAIIISNKAKYIFSEYAQYLMVPLIIASYMTAEQFNASGFMAVFVSGVILNNTDGFGWTIKETAKEEVHHFINIASLLLRTTIFILLGSNVNFTLVSQYLWQGLIIVAVFMFIARPVAVLFCTLPDRKAKWFKNEIVFMFWTRETGVIPVALSGIVASMQLEYADLIASIVFIAVLVTLLVQATTTKIIAKRLKVLEIN